MITISQYLITMSFLWEEHSRSTLLFMISFAMQRASLMAQMVKNLPTMWETWVRSLGWEDPLEKGTAPLFECSGLESNPGSSLQTEEEAGRLGSSQPRD